MNNRKKRVLVGGMHLLTRLPQESMTFGYYGEKIF